MTNGAKANSAAKRRRYKRFAARFLPKRGTATHANAHPRHPQTDPFKSPEAGPGPQQRPRRPLRGPAPEGGGLVWRDRGQRGEPARRQGGKPHNGDQARRPPKGDGGTTARAERGFWGAGCSRVAAFGRWAQLASGAPDGGNGSRGPPGGRVLAGDRPGPPPCLTNGPGRPGFFVVLLFFPSQAAVF
ncbi:hypothetical protein AGDE_17070 [Angomonas deanei]|nr:hypothetical protein AGDE_17070 [Angomonas deanei]|eukprot:EPY15559.1 hypothetical protein AGDE_17070 [Angomonas deanei]